MNRPRTSSDRRCLLLVISAPSGAGKTTLCNRLLAEFDDMVRSVSVTTRARRGQEVDGRDYHFTSDADFTARLRRNAFLEHAVVHGKNYGTPRKNVEDALKAGKDVLLAIDVQGAAQVREQVAASKSGLLKGAFVDIFIVPPSLEALEQRLPLRNEDSTDEIKRRLEVAKREMDCMDDYKYRVVNDDLSRAFDELKTIILSERAAPPRD